MDKEMIPDIGAFAPRRDYRNDYGNVLPSLNLRQKYSDQLEFRLAWTKSVSRPDFSQLQGYTSLNNAMSKQTMGTHFGDRGRAWFVSGPRYSVQANYNF